MKKFWTIFLIAGIAIVAMSAYQFLTRPDKGDLAPLFKLNSSDGHEVDMSQLRGSPVIVHFFASWCGPCQMEFPSLDKLYRDLKSEGLVVLAISEDGDDSRKSLASFLKYFSPQLTVLMDSDGAVADLYKSWTVPETLFVDRAGFITWRHSGPLDWDTQGLRERVKSLIHSQ